MMRIGIIGLGAQGKVYGSFLQEMEGITLGAVSSRDQEKQAWFPEVPFFTDWKTLIDKKTVDGVIITTPHKNHVEIASYCLENGIAVLVDKPIGVHIGEAEALNAVAKQHPTVGFGVLFNQRTNTIYKKARDLVQSGELGPLRKVDWICCNWWRPDSYYQQSPWRGTWTGEGGGILMNQAPHQLDIWQWICGMPTKLYGKARMGAYRAISVENDVSIVAEYENGAIGTFQTCAYDPLGTDRLEITLESGKILVKGGGKKATIYRLNQSETEMNQTMPMEEVTAFIQGKPLKSLYTTEELVYESGWGTEHKEIIANFVAHWKEGTPFIAAGEEGIHSLMIANAAMLSDHMKEEITLPIQTAEYLTWLTQQEKKETKA